MDEKKESSLYSRAIRMPHSNKKDSYEGEDKFLKKGNAIRRQNLYLYLREIYLRKPRFYLIGEAPGYQGTRRSGITFTSEFLLLKGIPEFFLLGEKKGYRKDWSDKRVWKEPTSTIVWETCVRLGFLPLLWAAYPFHPHKPGHPLTNRAPRQEEILLGQPFISLLLEIYRPLRIIAVGNKAEETLKKMNIPCVKVRHPSQGGKQDFVKGLKKLLKS